MSIQQLLPNHILCYNMFDKERVYLDIEVNDDKWSEDMGVFSLPDGYSRISEINLQKEKKATIPINAGVIVIMAALLLIGIAITPLNFGNLPWLLVSCAGLVLYVIAHELIHGFFIKKFSGKKARHKFTGLYALTGSEAYFTRRQYRVIAFAPVISLGITLLLLTIVLPEDWFWRVYFIQIANISMSFGDVYIAGFLLGRFDAGVLIKVEDASIWIYAQI